MNKWDPVDLKRVLKEYGEEPKAARIARAIVQSRPLNSTAELRDVVERQVAYNDRAKTLARVFQVHDTRMAWRRGTSEDRHTHYRTCRSLCTLSLTEPCMGWLVRCRACASW